MDFITLIFNVIIGLAFFLVQLILLPIDALIDHFLPGLADAFTAIATLLSLIASGLGWAISASGVPYAAIALIGTYWIFKLTLPWNIFLIKLAIKWYNAFKP